ncbi:MAG: hypothetical protein ACTSWN_14115 [Promethearchaeota archaeon]
MVKAKKSKNTKTIKKQVKRPKSTDIKKLEKERDKKFTGKARRVVIKDFRDKEILPGFRLPKVSLTSVAGSTISLPSPPKMIILMATYIFLFWLMAGGIYMMVRDPIALGAKSNGDPIYFYPSLNDSFIIEGFIASIMLFAGGFGGVLLYQATMQAYNRSYAIKLLIIGLVLCITAFFTLQWIINIKTGKA